ncbi:MAG: rhomboid family intramembrane serine protease [Mastigocoleus sp. MO_167.B18]|uniref:rhomboid family intramembrane serine protease n=1 Tax=Mastigocoleus sp. MO_188.B34 TaxID=3036635 RepID=UPI00261835B7|nr:rhomboid family intramembrane serine protease [Mastigocoleus sp. MO_188.B34]MDJ0693982.1 rhomboid family intramembrane serine protease [Mastigocoleus sp. MO_188.B34]MDJ0773883.1 rhomboid family intramembrane serine protease [Mastigocoleus sp. MO_167.B18]
MFPLSDENPTRITPYVTYGFIAINILVFLHEFTLPNAQLCQFFQAYALVPRQLSESFGVLVPFTRSAFQCPVILAANQGLPEWGTLFTSQFLHGGWWHLISNMVYLWVFGNNIEDRLGHFKYIIFYLACGALAALCQYIISPGSMIPSLGASGAIAGVLGAYVIRFPRAVVNTFVFLGIFITTIRVPAYILIGFFVIQNVISGLASLQTAAVMGVETGGVAYWAHIGGFVFGLILAPLLGLFNRDY